jgi:hypothetical protein
MTTLGTIPLLTGSPVAAGVVADGLATTLNGAALVNATTATLTSAAGFTPGVIVIISAGTATAELALITAVVVNTVTFADALQTAHATASPIARATVPWARAEHLAGAGPRSPYLVGG